MTAARAEVELLEFKEDWEQAQERLMAWWEQELVDRACLHVQSPRAGATQAPLPPPKDLWQQWTDVEYNLMAAEECMQRTFFGGEAFPLFVANLGPDMFSAFLGCEMTLAADTTWTAPIISDWASAPPLRLNRQNPWWQLMLRFLRESMARGQGRWLTCLPDVHNGPDALASLRGRQELCLDLYDHPQEVAAAMPQLCAIGQEVYEEYFAILQPERYGSCGWLPTWAPGRNNVIQCDFIALISPAAFQRYFADWLMAEVSCFDRVIYHLDGPPSLPHLDYLLELPQIKAIQWVPGDGALPMTRWLPVLKRIQAAGKSMCLSVEAWEVEIILAELSARGVLMQTWVQSEEEARELLKKTARWTHD
ncbi:MAG: hypothetical protein IT330_10225 [Anaerolineae bacterium]|nr:hypothetical protein [Anaerolineae bacterium]